MPVATMTIESKTADDEMAQAMDDGDGGDDRSATTEDRIVESIYHLLMESMCRDVAVNMHELIKTGADDVIPSSWKLFSGTKVPTRRELYPELYNGGTSDDGKSDNGNPSENGQNDSESPPSKRRLTDDEIQAELKRFAVDLPSSSSPLAGRKRRITRDMAEEEEKRRLLSKIHKEKESNYKESDDEDDEMDENTNDDEDEDDEDFKMEDADAEDDDDEDNKTKNKTKQRGRSMSTTSSAPEEPVSSSSNGGTEAAASSDAVKSNHNALGKLDIWGNNPPKEPKNRLCRCRLCGRLISTSRFASHLDKCMGLSTSRGGGPSGGGMLKSGAVGVMMKKKKRGSTLMK